MSLGAGSPWVRIGGLVLGLVCAVVIASPSAQADHEVSYYPSSRPQETRLEPLDPEAAAREFISKTDPLHAYVGTAPRFSGQIPEHLKSVESLKSLITVSVNPQSSRLQNREARCHAIGQAPLALAPPPAVVIHPYPITPFHSDYLAHSHPASPSKPSPEPIEPAAPP